MEKKAPAAPSRSKPQSQMPQVQHDAILAGGMFTIIGGILMLVSALLPWVTFEGEPLISIDLLNLDIVYTVLPAASVVGGLLVALTTVILVKVFASHKPLNRLPLLQALISMAGALLVIATFLLVRRDYQGSDSLFGAGAFTDVVGAILLMAGSMLIHLMSGHRRKPSTTGFNALAERSGEPSGRKEWQPPESSVKAPACPSCGEELRPGWKACPSCGYALLSDERERGRL
ncbi:MAG: zinc ribbon domain-containing protein [Methanomassiliicoccales archaeon]